MRLCQSLAMGLICGASLLNAQDTGVNLGGLATDTDAPVEVSSDQLTLDQSAGTATFSGNVVVTQGEMRLTAPEILVEYNQADGADAASGVERITAKGGVVMVTPSEAAESQEAVYTPALNEVVMQGDVLLTQGLNTLSGERLVVDLVTGNGRIEGRVRTILRPEQAP